MNKGFTLVELLAVIVILGVLTLIVTISTGTITKNSRAKLSNIQIENIKSAAQAYYLNEGINYIDYEEESSEMCVNISYLMKKGYMDKAEILDPKDNKKLDGSIIISYNSINYTYDYSEDNCACAIVEDQNNDGIADAGDKITCKTESFYVVSNENSKVSMLTEYNLDVGRIYNLNTKTYSDISNPTGLQKEEAIARVTGVTSVYGAIAFARTDYWAGAVDNEFVYRSNVVSGVEQNLLYPHIENYEEYLKENGVYSADATMISYEDVVRLKAKYGHPSWVTATTYWTGTTSGTDKIYRVYNDLISAVKYTGDNAFGLRPLIKINESELFN